MGIKPKFSDSLPEESMIVKNDVKFSIELTDRKIFMNYIRWVFCFELQVVLVIFMPETAIKLKAKKNFSE